MRGLKIRPRSIAMLAFAVTVALAAGASDAGAGRHVPSGNAKECYFNSQIYSLGACREGQRCVRGVNDEDYWEDDTRCSQTSPGGGGMSQV